MRARNIKPGFFKNDLLVELPFEYRILFIGIWTMADRDGRLEDRPTKIRMEVFPADSVDVNAGLQALHDAGFIARYQADGRKCIQVLAWAKHQNPHAREAVSTLPSMEEGARHSLGDALEQPRPGQAEELTGSARLIPDSLIPDSLNTEPNGSGADAPPPEPLPDPIWGTGLAFLIRKGIPEKTARALLGKIKQACGDVEAGAILADAETQDVSDPAPWLMTAAANARTRRSNGGTNANPVRLSAAERVLANARAGELADAERASATANGSAHLVGAHG